MWLPLVEPDASSPRYDTPASPLENDSNWDLPDDSMCLERDSVCLEDYDEEAITPLLPQTSQPPPELNDSF